MTTVYSPLYNLLGTVDSFAWGDASAEDWIEILTIGTPGSGHEHPRKDEYQKKHWQLA